MRKTLKRMLLAALALTLLGSIMLPAAMAAEQREPVSNASSTSVYAGMKTTLTVYRYDIAQDPNLFKWKSSKSSVCSVNSQGVITGKKVGTATITATRKSNSKDKCSIKVTVKRNKVDNINSKPSATAASSKNFIIRLKSVEIVSPTKVVAEYYLACNFPSSWKATKVNYVEDAIFLYNRSTGVMEKVIVGDDYQVRSKTISGFKTKKGKAVQTIKVTYTGSRVHCADIKLSDYDVDDSYNVTSSIRYYH